LIVPQEGSSKITGQPVPCLCSERGKELSSLITRLKILILLKKKRKGKFGPRTSLEAGENREKGGSPVPSLLQKEKEALRNPARALKQRKVTREEKGTRVFRKGKEGKGCSGN